jgi:hypothetical protein
LRYAYLVFEGTRKSYEHFGKTFTDHDRISQKPCLHHTAQSNKTMHLHSRKPRHKKLLPRLLQRTSTLLGILWALPLTLVGILLTVPVLFIYGRIYLVKEPTPALVVRGPVADYLLAHHPFGVMSAMAIGHVVIADRRSLTKQILTHELAHVRQASRWGIVFPFAYIASSIWVALHGHDAYWNNIFEIAARDAEKHS